MKNDKQKIIEAKPGFSILYYGNDEVEGTWVSQGEPVLFWHITYGLTEREKPSASVEPITINGEVEGDWALLNPNGSVSDPINREFPDVEEFKTFLVVCYSQNKKAPVRGKAAASPQPPVR